LPGLPTVEQQQHHQPADDSLCPSEALYLLMAEWWAACPAT
jgi:hypothetical protein